MLWELDEFQGPQFLGFIRNVPVPEAYAGASILPDQTTFDLEFSYILGSDARPVMANIIGWDSEAPIAGREPSNDRVVGELPPIKRKAKMSEKEIINRFLSPRAGIPDKQIAIDEVYKLVGGLQDSVQARVEWLRWQAMSEDVVTYSEDGVQFVFDFGFNTDYQIDMATGLDGAGVAVPSLTGVALSTVATADPINDWRYLSDLIENETGFRPFEMWCSNQAVSYMLENAALRTLIRGAGAPTAPLTLEEMNIALQIHGLPTIHKYDATIRSELANGTYATVRPLAVNKAVFLPGPEATIGSTLWGPTAESRSLVGTPYAAQAPGIYSTVYGKDEPPSEWAKSVGVAFPSLPGANLMGQVTLW